MPELYLVARLTLKYGALPRFSELMATLRPALEQRGWTLVGSYHPTIGELTEVLNVWRVPDANAAIEARREALRDPTIAAVVTQFGALIQREAVSLMTKTPYSP